MKRIIIRRTGVHEDEVMFMPEPQSIPQMEGFLAVKKYADDRHTVYINHRFIEYVLIND